MSGLCSSRPVQTSCAPLYSMDHRFCITLWDRHRTLGMLPDVVTATDAVSLAAACLGAGPQRLSIAAALISQFLVEASSTLPKRVLSHQLHPHCADLACWCEASEPQCPTGPQGQHEGVRASEPLGALPHGCLPGPRSPPRVWVLSFALFRILSARPAPFSAAGLRDLSGGQGLGDALGWYILLGREGAQTSLRTGMPFIPP